MNTPLKMPYSAVVLLGMISLLLLTTGCKTTYRLTDNKTTPDSQLAVLKGTSDTRLWKVDGNAGSNLSGLGGQPKMYNSKWNGKFTVYLEPGRHKLMVSACIVTPMEAKLYPWRTIEYTFESGRQYKLAPKPEGSEFIAEIILEK